VNFYHRGTGQVKNCDDDWSSCRQIPTKCCWGVGCLTSNKPFYSAADLVHNLDPAFLTEFLPLQSCANSDNWRAPWKNWISSITMKLRKSLVKPVTWQNISSCLVLPPEIVMHDACNVILWTSADICVVVHDDFGWKNRTSHCNRFWTAGCSWLEYVDIHLVY